MNDSDKAWHEDRIANGWEMPSAPSWKRMPFIRHIRSAWLSVRISEHENFWGRIGMVPSGYDRWVLYGIRKGWEAQQ